MRRTTHRRVAALLPVLAIVAYAEAQTQIDLNLVLAVDGSGSVNQAR